MLHLSITSFEIYFLEGKKRRGITSAVKRHAQKVLPISHKHHQSDISVDVNSSAKSSLKTSQSGEHISPTSHSAAGTPTGWYYLIELSVI